MIAAVIAATMAMAPLGLYHHVPATDLERPELLQQLRAQFALVTVRGDAGDTAGAVGRLLADRGNAAVFLYRRGTAVSEDEAVALEREHPEWLARDGKGAVVTSNAGGRVIDVTMPAVRDWLVAAIARDTKAGNYDGVYLDVLGAFFSARFYSARPVIGDAPLRDTDWRDACVALITAVKAATGKPVVANGFGLQSGKNYADHRADADLLIDAADGIQIEQFVRNGNMELDKYKPADRWREDIELLESVSRKGKIVLANTRVRSTADRDAVARQREYALASFLLGAHGAAARFRFAEGAATGVVDGRMAKTIANLGEPRGGAELDGDQVIRRFAHGQVSVDPELHNARIVVRGNTVTTAPPPRESPARFYAIGLAAAAVLAGALVYAAKKRTAA